MEIERCHRGSSRDSNFISPMKIWAVTFDPTAVKSDILDNLYNQSLGLVDLESQTKIKKYYKREDAFRSLIGNILPRIVLREQGLSNRVMSFAKTAANKPYINIHNPLLLPEPIGFNVTHDGGVVAMAYDMGTNQPWNDPPAHKIGVDVMKLALPDRSTFKGFVDTVGDALTVSEKASLIPDPPVSEGQSLHHFFLIWTLKEAYTKALGIGLGFDFKRIEYDSAGNHIKVDGEVLKGWEFQVFELPSDRAESGGYIGVVAIFVGGGDEETIVKTSDSLSTFTAEKFLNRAIRDLGSK